MKGRVVLAGALAQKAGYGGHAWVFVNWLVGLRRLGWEVLFLDRRVAGTDGREYLAGVMGQFGLENSYCLLAPDGESCAGMSRREAIARMGAAALLVNVNGFLDDPRLLDAARLRVYLDIDPGFGQMWRETGLHDAFVGHDRFVTLAENIGRPGCSVPTCGLDWITTRQPVVSELWPVGAGDGVGFTTVGAWRGPFAPVDYRGHRYGLRVHEFRKFAELPAHSGERFEAALDIDPPDSADVDLLRRGGWLVVRPETVVGDPSSYRDYVGRSKAEFMVAKSMYVDTRGGWFSDRSATYLASGRPVVAQDTGLQGLYELGCGLLAFSTFEEAAAAVESVTAHYDRHRRAAREIAEAYFDSDRVL